MTTIDIIFGILLLVSALFLIVAVLLQNGKSHGLSGTISGGAETFFGKQKGSTIDKKLSRLTTIVAIIFVVLVLVVYVIQDQTDYDALLDASTDTEASDTVADTDAADTAAESNDADTVADTGASDSGE